MLNVWNLFETFEHKSGTGVPALAEIRISDEGPWACTHLFMYLKTSRKKQKKRYLQLLPIFTICVTA